MNQTVQIIVDSKGQQTNASASTPKWFIDSNEISEKNNSSDPNLKTETKWGDIFSIPRKGNTFESFIDGESYFRSVAAAISGAKSSVFIASWQINYDVELVDKKTLFECLLDAIKNGATIYAMPWMAPPGPVKTGYFPTLLAVHLLNGHPEAKGKAFCLPAISQSDQELAGIAYAHHQKMVVIDNKKAFLGGIDLAYGRRDNCSFSLKSEGRELSEHYNTCIPAIHKITSTELVDRITTAELLSAAFFQNSISHGISTWWNSPSGSIPAAVSDIKDSAGDYIKESASKLSDYINSISLINDIKEISNKISDSPIDRYQTAAVWAWENFPDSMRQKIKSIVKYHGGNASDAISAVYAHLNGADLSLLPEKLKAEVAQALHALVYGMVAIFNAENTEKPRHYARLFEKIRSVPAGAEALDTSTQPRLPWQDVQCSVQGPSVQDISRNFIRRWDSIAHKFETSFSRYRNKASDFLLSSIGLSLPATPKAPRVAEAHKPVANAQTASASSGSCWVQVVRSASLQLQKDEAAGARSRSTATLPQNNCLKAMVRAIGSAQNFLYIEGQFYQCAHGNFGTVSEVHSGPLGALLDIRRSPEHQRFAQMLGIAGLPPGQMLGKLRWSQVDNVVKQARGGQYMQDLMTVLKNVGTVEAMRLMGQPQSRLLNPVGLAMIRRVERAINDELPFHIYLILPVHPEGTLDTLNIMSQTHLTQHSLAFGTYSLLNGVRRAILAKRYCKEKNISLQEAQKQVAQLQQRDISELVKEEWKQYLTLLNLRNWDTLDGKPVTEQIYIHSKLLIADDRVAIIGSANINDRSQLGDRDSELAVIVTDANQVKVKLDGKNTVDCGSAIHHMRRRLWEKHFGLRSSNRKASALGKSEVLDSPAAPSTWQAIQALAKKNTDNYEAAFWFIPRSGAKSEIQPKEAQDKEPGPAPASLWPTWKYQTYLNHAQGGSLLYRMPFDPLFWRAPESTDTPNSWNLPKDAAMQIAPTSTPGNIQGFITELPVHWTYRENNLSISTHIGVLAMEESPAEAGESTSVAASTPTTGTSQENA